MNEKFSESERKFVGRVVETAISVYSGTFCFQKSQ